MEPARLRLGPLASAVTRRLADMAGKRFAARLWAKDPTLWSPEPLPELADRLGWLDLPAAMLPGVRELERLAREVRADGIRRVVLLGMGGSSLAPEVFSRSLSLPEEGCALSVLDTTHPGAVLAAAGELDLERTLFVVASKSGGTVETLSLYRFFWERLGGSVDEPGRHVLAITDPGTPLERLAEERRFRAVVTAPPDVGGRFSALSVFGMVPAALMGADLGAILDAARAMAKRCRREGAENPGLELGVVLGEAALAGRNKLTLITSPGLTALPAWLEQLIAESTGKDGKGIVPVPRERRLEPAAVGEDRLFVALALAGEEDRLPREALEALAAAGHPVVELVIPGPNALGAEMFRWEVATAAAGAILGVHPFNQPDVQLAKELAGRALAGELERPGGGCRAEDPSLERELGGLLGQLGAGGYLAVQAFLAPAPATDAALLELETALRRSGPFPVTTGYGPRFLHSTGQLHKGGPPEGAFLQLVDTPAADAPIPETGPGFGALLRAQADGDLGALITRGRPVLRVELGEHPVEALHTLTRAAG